MATAMLSNQLDLTAAERELLKYALDALWSRYCRHARAAEHISEPKVAEEFRAEADKVMDLSVKLGLGLLG